MKLLFLFLLGSCLGSFLGVVIDRFPTSSILFPASHCNHCKHPLKAWDLIPIFSQIATQGKCRYCKMNIPIWYALFEFATACLLLLTELNWLSIGQFFLILCGLVLSIYDIKHREYPLVIWLIFAIIMLSFASITPLTIFFLIGAILSFFFNLKIGSGDFLYLASLSTFLNSYQIILLIQVSSLIGLFCFFLFRPQKSLPFIPCLLLSYLLIICLISP